MTKRIGWVVCVFGLAACAAEVDPTGSASEAVVAPPVDPQGLVHYTEARALCGNRDRLRNAYFGDLHVHTSYSFDAYVFDTRNDPAAAYRFARGETIMLPPLDENGNGTRPTRLARPLDFTGITDHSEFLGETNLCTTPGSPSYDTPSCATYRSGLLGFALFGARIASTDPQRSALICGLDGSKCETAATGAWQRIQAAAEGAYDRTSACRFTSFVGYEHTGSPNAMHVHRNVLFRNATVPPIPVTYFEEPTRGGLWESLRALCKDSGTGCDVLAIPHNSNLSGGRQFDLDYGGETTTAGQAAYAREQTTFEPLAEIYQHKGSSECSTQFPGGFFGADEQCGFESLDADPCNGDGSGQGTGCVARLDYVRRALGTGLSEQQRIGVNPFRYGIIASTDTHNATPGNTEEASYRGNVGTQDGTAARAMNGTLAEYSPGGLAGVWAVENSRDAIFEAMQRRETFGTSGTRIRVRFFGSLSYAPNLCSSSTLLETAYANGVPMGGELAHAPQGARPSFIVQAMKDGTPLQVAQIVKQWVDRTGQIRELVFDVAGNANNGAWVNPLTCNANGAGASTMCSVWTDPTFDPALPAVYYARVIENPTCRWNAHWCNSLPLLQRPPACSDPNIPRTTQERAWSSPIWYRP